MGVRESARQSAQLGSDGKAAQPVPTPPVPQANAAATGSSGTTTARLTSLRGKALLGCCAGNKHTVLFSASAVYVCGENLGQLGLPQADRVVTVPRYVVHQPSPAQKKCGLRIRVLMASGGGPRDGAGVRVT